MKTLVFGGSFDPPHVGHANLLRAAAERIRPDRILIIPAFQAPLKEAPSASASQREQMARLGILKELPPKWRRRARIDASELRSRRKIYTIDTLLRLKNAGQLHFAVGADAAACWSRWKKPEQLKSLCRWWTAARPGSWGRIPRHFGRIPGRMPEVSSTQLRRELAEGRDVSRWLAPAVLDYIRKNGLYGLGLLKKLSASLKESRYEHSLNVARLSAALARRWNEDEERARLAGLLHDCGRALTVDQMPGYVLKRGLKVPERRQTFSRHPLLLHAYIGEDLARRRFGLKDEAVLSAVRKHTLADRSMSRLDRIVYVADACSEDRRYAEAPSLRKLAFDDLEEAFAACLRLKLYYALQRRAWIHPLTVNVWNNLAAKS